MAGELDQYLEAPQGQVPALLGDRYVREAAPPPLPPLVQIIRALLESAPPTLAATGGIAGTGSGVFAGPMAPVASPMLGLGLAGAGYATGQNIRDIGMNLLNREPAPNPLEASRRTLNSFLTGAAQEGTGLLGGKMATGLWNTGKRVARAEQDMANILDPGEKLLKKSPRLVRNALREQVPIAPGMSRSDVAELEARRAASTEAEDKLAAAYDLRAVRPNIPTPTRAGRKITASEQVRAALGAGKVTPSEIIDEIRTRREMRAPRNARASALHAPYREAEQSFIQKFSTEPRASVNDALGVEQPFSTVDLLREKRWADVEASRLHDARMAQGTGAGKTAQAKSPEELFYEDVSNAIRRRLREVPGLGKQMKRTQDLMMLGKAYSRAGARPSNVADVSPVVEATAALAHPQGVPARFAARGAVRDASRLSQRAIRDFNATTPTVTEKAGTQAALRSAPRLVHEMARTALSPARRPALTKSEENTLDKYLEK